MINKSKLWFFTLSCIIVVLSIYYIALPNDTLNVSLLNTNEDSSSITILESEEITSMKVLKEEEELNELKTLQEILLDNTKDINEKNDAYSKIKNMNTKKSIETKIVSIIKNEYNLNSFVNIKDNNISILVENKENNYNLANKIIKKVNEYLNQEYYITVKFN